jgi:hypothetical protein
LKIGGLILFWKKKKEEKKMFEVPEGNRGSYRVYPSDDEPILIKIKGGKTSKAVDICAGGISFPNDDHEIGSTHECKIKLSRDVEPFAAKVIIHKIDDTNICRCSITDTTDEMDDMVHHYVMGRQREDIQAKKTKF